MSKRNLLQRYRERRNFKVTPEPSDKLISRHAREPMFVVQKHDATLLHYDARLEAEGVLKKPAKWLLIKIRDADAAPGDITKKSPDSVLTGRSIEEVREAA